jgi:hypothetical protein
VGQVTIKLRKKQVHVIKIQGQRILICNQFNQKITFYCGKQECAVTVINNLTEQRDIDWAKYAKVLDMFPASTGKDIVSGKTVTKEQVFSVGGQSA